MRQSPLVLAGLLCLLAGCFDFDGAYARYCGSEKCGPDAGTGGGTGGSAGGGTGGGVGGAAGGGTGGATGGGIGGAAGGGAGGGSGGGGGGGSGPVDAGFCGGNWCVYSRGGTGVFTTTQGLWAASPDDAWLTSFGSRLLHWNGVSWQKVNITDFSVTSSAVWGLGATVFVGADNGYSYRGPPFTSATSIAGAPVATLVAINGLPDGGSIYASGIEWDIYRYDGTQWVPSDAGPPPAPVPTLRGLAVLAANDIWSAGSYGTVLHNDGTGWQRVDSGVTDNIRRAFATGPNDVWFVGQNGLVLRWNGTGFTKTFCPTADDIWGVWGRGPNDMWLADSSGALVHWDGGSFSTSIAPAHADTAIGLSGAGDWDLFVSTIFDDAGYGVLHYRR